MAPPLDGDTHAASIWKYNARIGVARFIVLGGIHCCLDRRRGCAARGPCEGGGRLPKGSFLQLAGVGEETRLLQHWRWSARGTTMDNTGGLERRRKKATGCSFLRAHNANAVKFMQK